MPIMHLLIDYDSPLTDSLELATVSKGILLVIEYDFIMAIYEVTLDEFLKQS